MILRAGFSSSESVETAIASGLARFVGVLREVGLDAIWGSLSAFSIRYRGRKRFDKGKRTWPSISQSDPRKSRHFGSN